METFKITHDYANKLLKEGKIDDIYKFDDEFKIFVNEYGYDEWMDQYFQDPDNPTDSEIQKVNIELFEKFKEKFQ